MIIGDGIAVAVMYDSNEMKCNGDTDESHASCLCWL